MPKRQEGQVITLSDGLKGETQAAPSLPSELEKEPLKRQTSMTETVALPGTELPGDETSSSGRSLNLEQTCELSSMYISKSLISIFCFLSPDYYNKGKYCNSNKTHEQRRTINNLLQSPVKTTKFLYDEIGGQQGMDEMEFTKELRKRIFKKRGRDLNGAPLWECITHPNTIRNPIIYEIFRGRRYPELFHYADLAPQEPLKEIFENIGFLSFSNGFRVSPPIKLPFPRETIFDYIAIQNNYDKLFDLAPRPSTQLTVYKEWGSLPAKELLNGEYPLNCETYVTLIHSCASIDETVKVPIFSAAEERNYSYPKFPNDNHVTTLIRIKKGSHGIINLSMPDQEANSEISKITSSEVNIAYRQKSKFELVLDPRGALFPTFRKVVPESLNNISNNRVSYDEFLFEPIPMLSCKTVYYSQVFDEDLATTDGNYILYKPLVDTLCQVGNYSEAIFENFGVGYFINDNKKFIRGHIQKKEKGQWIVKQLAWPTPNNNEEIPDVNLQALARNQLCFDLTPGRGLAWAWTATDEEMDRREETKRSARKITVPFASRREEYIRRNFPSEDTFHPSDEYKKYSFKHMSQNRAKEEGEGPLEQREDLIFKQNQLVQFEDYERVESSNNGRRNGNRLPDFCFQKKITAIYDSPDWGLNGLGKGRKLFENLQKRQLMLNKVSNIPPQKGLRLTRHREAAKTSLAEEGIIVNYDEEKISPSKITQGLRQSKNQGIISGDSHTPTPSAPPAASMGFDSPPPTPSAPPAASMGLAELASLRPLPQASQLGQAADPINIANAESMAQGRQEATPLDLGRRFRPRGSTKWPYFKLYQKNPGTGEFAEVVREGDSGGGLKTKKMRKSKKKKTRKYKKKYKKSRKYKKNYKKSRKYKKCKKSRKYKKYKKSRKYKKNLP